MLLGSPYAAEAAGVNDVGHWFGGVWRKDESPHIHAAMSLWSALILCAGRTVTFWWLSGNAMGCPKERCWCGPRVSPPRPPRVTLKGDRPRLEVMRPKVRADLHPFVKESKRDAKRINGGLRLADRPASVSDTYMGTHLVRARKSSVQKPKDAATVG